MKIYHWMFLAQTYPMPEMLIEKAPSTISTTRWRAGPRRGTFPPSTNGRLRITTHYATPEHIHATCEDYRAGETYDLAA